MTAIKRPGYRVRMPPDDVQKIADFVEVPYRKVAAIVALTELRLQEAWDEEDAAVLSLGKQIVG